MSRGILGKYVMHDCLICLKEVPIEYIKNGEGKTYPPCLYNKKKTCCEACKQKLLKQYRQKYWATIEKQRKTVVSWKPDAADIFNGRKPV